MGTMVYSLPWVMQDFVHQQYHRDPNIRALKARAAEKRRPVSQQSAELVA